MDWFRAVAEMSVPEVAKVEGSEGVEALGEG